MIEREVHLYGKKELNKQQIIKRELKEDYIAPAKKFSREYYQTRKEVFIKQHASKIVDLINSYLQSEDQFHYDFAQNIANIFPDIFQNIDKYNLRNFNKRHSDDHTQPALYDYYSEDDVVYDKLAGYLSLAFIKENFEKKGGHYYAANSNLLIDGNAYGMKTYDYHTNTLITGKADSLESIRKMYASQMSDTIIELLDLNEQQRQNFATNEKMQEIFANVIEASKLSR